MSLSITEDPSDRQFVVVASDSRDHPTALATEVRKRCRKHSIKVILISAGSIHALWIKALEELKDYIRSEVTFEDSGGGLILGLGKNVTFPPGAMYLFQHDMARYNRMYEMKSNIMRKRDELHKALTKNFR